MEKIPDIIHESWHPYLQKLFDDDKMKILKNEIIPRSKFYPIPQDIFKVFRMPLNSIKVVILGQDPYPNGEAIGLAFAVNNSTPIPASLNIILKEVIKPKTSEEFVAKANAIGIRTLQSWEEQGVFLLNTALTVEAKNAGSHMGYWNWFTTAIIKVISKEVTPIWMLWGAKAQSFESIIRGEENFLFNEILKAPHPAAELYSGGGGKTFSGCNHFELANTILKGYDKQTINW